MRIIDTYPALLDSYEGGAFCFERWRAYIDRALPGLSPALIEDAQKSLRTGAVSWRENVLPALCGVAAQIGLCEEAHRSFLAATQGLGEAIAETFGRPLDADVVFYLGLCNGAGWATRYENRRAVLIGLEKIVELRWHGRETMLGLIRHELGHVYHGRYGALERKTGGARDAYLWQMFSEGVAMVFEQMLADDLDYFHQDRDGWLRWCDAHLAQIKRDFCRDLPEMTPANQRYFGDLALYEGHGDVGYYLGCRFVQDLLGRYSFNEIIRFEPGDVAEAFGRFAA